jgi:hypothetical protein
MSFPSDCDPYGRAKYCFYKKGPKIERLPEDSVYDPTTMCAYLSETPAPTDGVRFSSGVGATAAAVAFRLDPRQTREQQAELVDALLRNGPYHHVEAICIDGSTNPLSFHAYLGVFSSFAKADTWMTAFRAHVLAHTDSDAVTRQLVEIGVHREIGCGRLRKFIISIQPSPWLDEHYPGGLDYAEFDHAWGEWKSADAKSTKAESAE